MDVSLLGAAFVRSACFAGALVFLPLPFTAMIIRIFFAVTLFVSCLGQLVSSAGTVPSLVFLKSFTDFQTLLPSSGVVAYNAAVGFFFALIISTAISAAFLSARWVAQVLQTRFSRNSLVSFDELSTTHLVLSLILAASIFIADFFFQLFSTFQQSLVLFPLLPEKISAATELSARFAAGLIQMTGDIFLVAFLSSSFLFFAVFVIVVSLMAGIKYFGQAAIKVTDSGLSFVFIILVLSASMYASSALLEKAHNEAVVKLDSLKSSP